MIDKFDLLQSQQLEAYTQTTKEAASTYQELNQSLINIKNNIMECIHGLENTMQIKPALIDTMRNTMQNIEHAKEVVSAMKHCLEDRDE